MDYTLKIRNSDKTLKIKKIFCVGLNYALHIDEMGSKRSETPVVFMKPATAILKEGNPIELPSFSENIHHEVELVIVIGKSGKNIKKENAYDHILGWALGLDLTLRDLQGKAKKDGKPWTVCKGFDGSAPISDIILKNEISNAQNIDLKLWVNGELRQDGNTRDMLFKIDELIEYFSSVFTLEEGDLIMTGTPEGVSQIIEGDHIRATLGDKLEIQFNVK